MEKSITRNKAEARRIESWLHRQIAELGTTRIAEVGQPTNQPLAGGGRTLFRTCRLLLAILISNRDGVKEI